MVMSIPSRNTCNACPTVFGSASPSSLMAGARISSAALILSIAEPRPSSAEATPNFVNTTSPPTRLPSPSNAEIPPRKSSPMSNAANFSTAAARTYSALAVRRIPAPELTPPVDMLDAIVRAVNPAATLISPSMAASPITANNPTAPASTTREVDITRIAAPEPNFVLAEKADMVVIRSIRVLMLVMAASSRTS